jgi:uncharacterized protein
MFWNIAIATASAWLITRIIKLAVGIKKEGKFEKEMLYNDGGMPSSHTAFVFGLAASVYLDEGMGTMFAVALGMALIVAYDAMKVRHIVGEHSRLLNAANKGKKGFEKLEESVGHTLPEVIGGAIIGVIVPLILYLWIYTLF